MSPTYHNSSEHQDFFEYHSGLVRVQLIILFGCQYGTHISNFCGMRENKPFKGKNCVLHIF